MSVGPPAVEAQLEGGGRVGRIPVRNLWLLTLYASDLFRSDGAQFVGVEDNPDDLPDLIARILADEVELRLRHHLTSRYRPQHAELSRVRGRIDMLTTERRQLLQRGRVACVYEEITVNTPRNRFVRAALEKMAALVTRGELSLRCRRLATSFKHMGVAGLAPSRAELSLDRLTRNDLNDRRMLSAAILAFELALPTEVSGDHWFTALQREEAFVRRLFERAVAGFYDVALTGTGWQVRAGGELRWRIEAKTEGIDRILPHMRTDVILDHAASKRRVVIDTKFNAILTQGWYREESLRSGYLYQIYAYLRSQVGQGDELADVAMGLLLHPAVDGAVDETVVIQGHAIRFATVDLAASSQDIRRQLLKVVRAHNSDPRGGAAGSVRVVAWNCMRRLEAKREPLMALAPDLAIIGEATAAGVAALSPESALCSEPLEGPSGLCVAIIGNNGWRLEKLAEATDRHVLAARAIKNDRALTIVGVWMLPEKGDYIMPCVRALREMKGHLTGEVIVAGDFNAHPQFDEGKASGRRFSALLEALGDAGLESLWHTTRGELHGQESAATFFKNLRADKPFHIDYMFASPSLAQRCRSLAVGEHSAWAGMKLSDHAPLIADIGDEFCKD